MTDGFPVWNDVREDYVLTSFLFYFYFSILVEPLYEIGPPALGNGVLLIVSYAIIGYTIERHPAQAYLLLINLSFIWAAMCSDPGNNNDYRASK